jgi:dolichol-phosphate mannosyltransferase
MAFAAGLYGAFLIIRFLLHPYNSVPGWLSTFTALVFIGGLILMNLGVIGIYIGRIYNQTKGRPLYVIDEIVGLECRNYASQASDDT